MPLTAGGRKAPRQGSNRQWTTWLLAILFVMTIVLQAFNDYEATFGAVHVNLNVAGPHQARALVEPARVDHTIQGANNPDGRKKGTNKKKEAKH